MWNSIQELKKLNESEKRNHINFFEKIDKLKQMFNNLNQYLEDWDDTQ